ncbi:MAG: hypothetical protein JW783_10155 [Bacteroidales bacterium]|nr:hypothetical protein [Bacteroidales bacterium]MBN2750099.1 hypothetical protein [Bacteroidales bacterium]
MKNIITVILIFFALFMCSITATAQSEVGSIPGSFNVTPNGASAYQIPIEMPAGAGGLTPHISIQYNSQGGWGLLGFGWDLNGLSYIAREGCTLAQDGHYSAVNYSTDDRLSLDGNRMVPISGAYWGESTQYGTENETFSKIETVKVGTSMCFKVTTKDGTILEYGFTADSRFLPIGSSTPYQWWLNKVRDKNGNYYTINYKNSGGQIVPQKIVYSKNEAVTTPGLEIQFVYNSTFASKTTY